jgi:hypothetical protein
VVEKQLEEFRGGKCPKFTVNKEMECNKRRERMGEISWDRDKIK